jgi:hypothetical protein
MWPASGLQPACLHASGSSTIETTLAEPAMLYVTVTASTGAPAVHLGAAIAPTQLKPPPRARPISTLSGTPN